MPRPSSVRSCFPEPSPHACLLRGRRPAQGRDGPDRQRFVAAGRGRFRQAPQDQGGGGPVALRGAVAGGAHRGRAKRVARARSELPVGGFGRRRFRLRRARARILRTCAGSGRGGRGRHGARGGADVLLQAGQGSLPQGAARRARRRARVGRAQEARGRADGRVVRRASRGPAARRDAREAADAALQAGQECARVEGARRGVRSAAEESGGAPGRVRRHTVDARLPLQRVSGAGVSAGHLRSRRYGAPPPRARAAAWPMSAHSRSTTRRRRKSTTLSRCASCRTGTTRSASISLRRRSAFRAALRSTRGAGAAVDGLHARPQAHDAARRRRGHLHAGRRPQSARAVAVRGSDARTATLVRHETRINRVPVAANLRLDAIDACVRRRSSGAVRSALDGRASRALEVCATAVGCARQGGLRAHRLQLRRRLGRNDRKAARRPCAHRPAAARQPARQAHRRAHDLRQQPVGQAARRRASRGPLPDADRTAR